nr:dihydropteroate synthase [Jonesia quinghaiensis]
MARGKEVGGRGGASGAVMAIINRTTDSFWSGARQAGDADALRAAEKAVGQGADIIDIGGVRAGTGQVVDVNEELGRVIPFIKTVRSEFPDVLVSVDTWRAEVAVAAADAGADIINDTWAGHDPRLVKVAAQTGLALVCSHTGGMTPRTDPFRVGYPLGGEESNDPRDGVLHDVLETVLKTARAAQHAGVPKTSLLLDPTHDFGKNTWHSLHLVRRTQELVRQGYPVLMALSRKDFVGESLGLAADERLEGTLAATAIAAWHGARVFRAHDVQETRRVLDMIAALRGDVPPIAVTRATF